MKRLILPLVLLALTAPGCETKTVTQVGTDLGVISANEKGSIDRTSEAFRRSFQDLTEEEEYYLGRAVAANLIQRYGLANEPEFGAYLNRVGRSVSLYSSRPEIFGGWHFAVLASDEVNAFSAPGGFVFVTRGLLGQVRSEDELGVVLGHEVAHVAFKHGLAAINKNRLMEAFGVLGEEAGKTFSQEEITKLTELYQGAVGDIVKTLVESGYSRDQEREADRNGVTFASGVGYDADAMLAFLKRLEQAGTAGGQGAFSTHPPAAERLAAVEPVVSALPAGTDPAPRRARFEQALAGI